MARRPTNGLATGVGRHGGRLSGGQLQRVALARALLADFPILVLDEPAEHVDPLAGDLLLMDLLRVTEGHSLVLITHRLTGLESVDEILVMGAGRVVERGTHDELLAAGGGTRTSGGTRCTSSATPPHPPVAPSTTCQNCRLPCLMLP